MGEKVRLHPGQAQLPGRWGDRVGILGVALKCLEGLSEGMLGADLFLAHRISLPARSNRGAGHSAPGLVREYNVDVEIF